MSFLALTQRYPFGYHYIVELIHKQLIDYVTPNGDCPISDWLSVLDTIVAARIRARLKRVACGNMGDAKSVGQGVSELRFSFGSGYRVYFASFGDQIIVLLCGGDKNLQAKDIQMAKDYWHDFKRRNNA